MKIKIAVIMIYIGLILITSVSTISGKHISKNYFINERLDQYQDKENGYKEIKSREWQEFIPTISKHYRIEVKIRVAEGEVSPIRLYIEKPLGTVLISKELPASTIPKTADWASFDIEDINLNSGEIYYIVLTTSPSAYYFWYGSSNNPYPNGDSSRGSSWDWCFKTFVEKSKSKILNNILCNSLIDLNKRLLFFENYYSFNNLFIT
jgi:hypothetical protein